MQLFLDTFGIYLSMKDGQFSVRAKDGTVALFPVREVNAIFLNKGMSVSTDAMMMALEQQIPMVLLDGIGHPMGLLWSGQFGSTSLVRRNQVLFAEHVEGWKWSAQWLRRKLTAQKLLLTALGKFLEEERDLQKKLTKAIPVINHSLNCLERWQPDADHDASKVAATFRGWEGTASRHYFRCISAALPPDWRFEGRSFRPATDPFNALLNYLYGVLYALVELSLIKAGIDPSLAILHADQYNRPTMVYDFIEPFRPMADRVAYLLIQQGKLQRSDFEVDESGGFRLFGPAKGMAVAAFFDHLEERISYGKQQVKRGMTLDLEAIGLATLLRKFKAK